MKATSILKGKIAESLVEEMLTKAGNRVYRFGAQDILRNLVQSEKKLDRETEIGRKITSIPDLVVISQMKKPIFVEVKFRTDPEALEEQLLLEKEYLEKFWDSKIILVTIKKPYFRVINPPYFTREKKEGWPIPVLNWQPIEADLDLEVKYSILKKFEKLVEKHYSQKKKRPFA
jgi:hypothetical protein